MSALPIVLLTLAGASASDPVIRAGDVTLSAAAVTLRAGELSAGGNRLTAEQIVDGMATEVALAHEAKRTGVAASPDATATVERERTRALAAAFTQSLSPDTVPDAEILRAFHEGSDLARLSVVVLESREAAAAARARIEAGSAFAAEALHSLDPRSSSTGGDTGPKPRAQFDAALRDEVFRVKPGALIGPVQLSNGGWAVARLEERAIANEADLPAARARIVSYVRRQAVGQARAHAIEMYRRSVAITVNESFLQSLGGRIEPKGDEAGTVVASVGVSKIRYRDLLPALRELSGVGHGSVTLKRQVVDSYVDDLLLAAEARRRGLDSRPETKDALALAEIRMLAQAMARSLLPAKDRASSPEQMNALLAKRAAEIRKRANVWIDRPAALAAAGSR